MIPLLAISYPTNSSTSDLSGNGTDSISFEQLIWGGVQWLQQYEQSPLMYDVLARPSSGRPLPGCSAEAFSWIRVRVYDSLNNRLVTTENDRANIEACSTPTAQPYSPRTKLRLWSLGNRHFSFQQALQSLNHVGLQGPWLRMRIVYFKINPFSGPGKGEFYYALLLISEPLPV